MYTGYKNNLKQCCLSLFLGGWLMLFGSAAAGNGEDLHQLAQRAQLRLNALHNANSESDKIRQFELLLNDEGFLRYRRTYINGKQEYYSFNLMRIKTIDYLGNTSTGKLTIETQEDDVIVQTFNDRSGNVDSMSTQFRLSLNRVEVEDLIILHSDLLEMKRLLDKNK